MAFQTGGEIKQIAKPFQAGGNIDPQPISAGRVGPPAPFGTEGTELVSERLTDEEVQQLNQERFEFEFNEESGLRGNQTRAILSLPKSERASQIMKLSPLHLLEAVADTDPIRNFADRKRMVQALEMKGVPKSAIEEFVLTSRGPEGLKGFLKQEAVPTAFEVAGGLVGGRVGKPIRGAVLGRGVGELVQRAGERILVTERQKSIGQDVTEAGINTTLAGLGEFGSRKIIETGGLLLKPAGRTRKFGVGRAQEILQEAGEQVTRQDIPANIGEIAELAKGGVGLADPAVITPGAATNSALFGLLDNVSEKAVTSMQRVRSGRLRNIVAFGKHTDNVLDEFAEGLSANLSPSQLGGVLNDVIQGEGGAIEAARDIYRPFYKDLDALTRATFVDVTEDVVVPTGVIDEFGKPITRKTTRKVGEKLQNGVSNKPAKKIAQELVDLVEKGRVLRGTDESATFIKNVSNLADDSTFSEAITNRSQILSLARRFKDLGEPNAARLAGELGKAMDTSMEEAARKSGPEAFQLWRRGNAVFKAVNKRFDSKVINELAKKAAESPELAVKTIFKNDEPTRILKVKKILLSPSGKTAKQIAEGRQTWKQLQSGLVENIFRKSRSTDKIIFGTRLESALTKLGDEALNATFSPQQVSRLKETARLGVLIQGKIKGEGGMLIQLAQPGAAASLISGKARGSGRMAALAVLGIPQVWSRMALDPKMSQILINGLADINKEGIKASTAATQKLLRTYFKERDKFFLEQAEVKKQRKKRLDELRRQQEPGLQQLRGFGGRGL